ncbi:Rap1a/Tai family immunity protein [Acetobacter fallax]
MCVGLLVAAADANAQRVSPMKAGNFGRICSRPAGAQVCDAYISGVADAGALGKVNNRNEGDPKASAGFCIPQTESGVAMRGKVVSWLKAHQDVLDKPVGEGVFMALHDSYPCGAAIGSSK